MELQTGEFPGWDRPPVAFRKTRVVSQFATMTTTMLSELLVIVAYMHCVEMYCIPVFCIVLVNSYCIPPADKNSRGAQM